MTLRDQLRAAVACSEHWQRIARDLTTIHDSTKDELWDRAMRAEDFIHDLGYRRCNTPACNCNSWHKLVEDK
jgi:hypothetical protein